MIPSCRDLQLRTQSFTTLPHGSSGKCVQGLRYTLSEKFAEKQGDAQIEGTILSGPRVDACIVTVNKLFAGSKIRGRNSQKLYAHHYSKKTLEAINQLLGTIICFVQFLEPGSLSSMKNVKLSGERKCTIIQVDCQATYHTNVPSSGNMTIAIGSNWFKAFVRTEEAAVHAFYITEISKSFRQIITKGPDVCFTGYESDEYLEV